MSRAIVPAASSVLVAVALVLAASSAEAQTPSFDIGGLRGSTDTAFLPGMTEIFTRIDNPTAAALKGEVLVRDRGDPTSPVAARAVFFVAPMSTAVVKIPASANVFALQVEVIAGGALVASKTFSADAENAIRVLDVDEPSRVRPMIDGLTMQTAYNPQAFAAPGTPLRVHVATPFRDQASGAFALPSFVTSWQGIELVVAPSTALDQLPPDELQALYGHVLGGATLALTVSKPEDLRSAALMALVGDAPGRVAPTDAAFAHFEPTLVAADLPKFADVGDRPPELVRFASYAGGNLVPNIFGASATYGLGEVVLLGFDPNDVDVAKEPWAAMRLAELARRAHDRFQKSTIRPGFLVGPRSMSPRARPASPVEPVANLLDPNTAARWSIGVASLLICGYAIVAGPLNFARAKKKNKPLQALLALPILSVAAFLAVVVFGFLSKGVSRRSNRLTYVEAGAGMEQGVVRRYRAFFSPFSQSVEVRASSRLNMLEVANDEDSDRRYELDGDGLRMGNIQSMPAQTALVREEGIANVGGSVAIAADGDGIIITNRLKHDLRGLVVHLPDDTFRMDASLAAGASVKSTELSYGNRDFETWASQFGVRGASVPVETLNVWPLKSALEASGESELGEAWVALASTAPARVDWFPSGVPVVLARVDGGSGDKKDSGIGIDHDWYVVRIVGFGGGAP